MDLMRGDINSLRLAEASAARKLNLTMPWLRGKRKPMVNATQYCMHIADKRSVMIKAALTLAKSECRL